MEALILLVPLSLVAVGVAVAIFFRMNASGQFDDDVGPAWSVLMDDDRAPSPVAPEDEDGPAPGTTSPEVPGAERPSGSGRGAPDA